MPFCTNCGSQLPPSSKFCPECGTKAPETNVSSKAAQFSSANRSPDSLLAPSKQNQGGSLTGTTQAVRSYMASASEEEKEKKYGQQKWGLFETDYQRRKGITTEQSLQEIEDFAKNGVTVGASGRSTSQMTSPPRGASSDVYGTATPGTTRGFSQANAREFDGGSGGRAGFTGSANSPRSGAGGFGSGSGSGRGQGTGTFGNGDQCDAGAKFFMQHQETEARKYKPGYKGQPYK